jgi:RNA polymerase sigma-70 factor (sigma-E family)
VFEIGQPLGPFRRQSGERTEARLNESTIREFLETTYPRLVAGVGLITGSRAAAEDAVQEALARAFVHWRKVRGYGDAWVVRVAGNLAIDAWRRTRRLQHEDAPDSPTPEPDAARIDLHRALRTLSRRQREVLVLRFLADLPEAEVARALGCSIGSVKVHASRGLATLRTTMGAEPEVA